MNPLNAIDFYKADHRSQYPEGTELVFSNWTPRSSRIAGIDEVVFFGLSYYIKEFLIHNWNENFFEKSKSEVIDAYKRRMTTSGITISYDHVEALHDLGYLPLEIWALPEGTASPVGIPQMVMWNTHPEFFWLTNYLETSISTCLWGPCTSATIAKEYRRILLDAARLSGGSEAFVDWQCHDFSMRGLYGLEAGVLSGMGHLLSFTGTDTIPAIDGLERYYHANADNELIGGSVPATEHSVMCMGGSETEIDTYRRLITQVYPSGIVSIVSDTWDYWGVITKILPDLKNEIMSREGTLTIRPDSGDPVKIICGDSEAPEGSNERKGSIELLWEIFCGVVNDKGFKQLDPHINLIYGDSITMDRASQICNQLIYKRFVPSMVLGIGSYTYQMQTRDSFGYAIKATYGEVNGEPREIFKDPLTDSAVGGSKKSAKGLLAVDYNGHGELVLTQSTDWDHVRDCTYELRFENGISKNDPVLSDVRATVRANS